MPSLPALSRRNRRKISGKRKLSRVEMLGLLCHKRWYNHITEEITNLGINTYFDDYTINNIFVQIVVQEDKATEVIYEYVPINQNEFQFGRAGDILTNYYGEFSMINTKPF